MNDTMSQLATAFVWLRKKPQILHRDQSPRKVICQGQPSQVINFPQKIIMPIPNALHVEQKAICLKRTRQGCSDLKNSRIFCVKTYEAHMKTCLEVQQELQIIFRDKCIYYKHFIGGTISFELFMKVQRNNS